jgi:phasin family protein
MMADKKSTADKARETINERIIDPAKKAGEAMRASGAKMAENSSTIGAKMIDQAEANAKEAFAAMRAAASAKDLSEVMKIQGDFLRDQGSRSMGQAREIGELIMQFGRDAVAPLRGDKG